MRTLLLLLALSSFALALVPMPVGIDAVGRIPENGIAVGINIDSDISLDNIESAKYTIQLSNPTNFTMFVKLPITFNYKPESISLERNGKAAELSAETEQQYFATYSERIGLEPNENATYVLAYKALRTPNEYGVWALKYYYTPPISFFEAVRQDNVPAPAVISYSGEIRFGYPVDKVSCGGCVQADSTSERADLSRYSIVKINGKEYFSLNWEKKRTPIRAGIVYLMLLAGILLAIVRARTATSFIAAPKKKIRR